VANKIFINYRREDTLATAGRLHDRFAAAFGDKNIFMDVEHIPAGEDFVKHLRDQVSACQVLLALVGPHWLEIRDATGKRRIDHPEDFVRIEISSALNRDIRVIPVLVDGASMPKVDELPEDLRALSTRHAVELRNTQFHSDAERLVERVHKIVGVRSRKWPLRIGAAGVLALMLCLLAVGLELGWHRLLQKEEGQQIPWGFVATDFRLVDRARPPVCETDAAVKSEPVPISASGLPNLALLTQAKARASSLLPGFPNKHQVSFLNDGWYNNCRSWIPARMPAWIELDLGSHFEISIVKFGSEHTPFWRDRAATKFSIQVRLDRTSEWATVYDHPQSRGAINQTSEFRFVAQRAQFVQINILETEQGDQVRVDETEIYGRPPQ
jgi:hypothetical protein